MTRVWLLFGLSAILCPAAAVGNNCTFDDLSFTADFEGGRLDGCNRLGDSEFELLIRPEHIPINNSAWYAFRVVFAAESEMRPLHLHFRYANGTHRYRPKLRALNDGAESSGHMLSTEQLLSEAMEKSNVFELVPSSRSLMISAQHLLTNADHQSFLDTMSSNNQVARTVLGQSVDGRDIEALLVEHAGKDAPYVVLLGRQHPPEVPGALALQALLRPMLDDTPVAREFRASFNIAAIPNLNPDGVARGNWRLNANNVDLNRDWGPFTQPETKAAQELLDRIGAAGPDGGLWLLLDFHSTHRDVFYVQSAQRDNPLSTFSNCWLERVDRALPDYAVRQEPTRGAGGTTAKTWATEVMHAQAITYEVGDETGSETIESVATTAAAEMMRQLIQARRQTGPGCGCGPCVVDLGNS